MGEGDTIGVLKFPAKRNPCGYPMNDNGFGKGIHQVFFGKIRIEIGIKSENDFLDFFRFDALKQFADTQVFGKHTVQRRYVSSENMISSLINASLLNGEHILDTTNDTKFSGVTFMARADGTSGNIRGEETADGTTGKFLLNALEGLRESLETIRWTFDQVKSVSAGGLVSNARKL